MTMPAHARALLDDLFGARDTIDSLIAGIERFYGADEVTPAPQRRVKAPKLTQPNNTPWVDPATNGHSVPPAPTPAAAPIAQQRQPANRAEDILHVLKKGPPVGLSCADITRAACPDARGDELKALTSKFWTTLQTMTRNGLLVEDSRLYTIAKRDGDA